MKKILTILLVLNIYIGFGQIESQFYGKYPESLRLIKNDTTGNYFICNEDTNLIVYFSKNKQDYKLYNKNYKLLVDGEVYTKVRSNPTILGRNGKWTEYYNNGKPKTIGYYYYNNLIGLWQHFYENGQLKETYTYTHVKIDSIDGFCRAGSYQSYYMNGQLKVNGFYEVNLGLDTIETLNGFVSEANYMFRAYTVLPNNERTDWTGYFAIRAK